MPINPRSAAAAEAGRSQVEKVVIEVAADAALSGGRERHALRFLRIRPDLIRTDIHRPHIALFRSLLSTRHLSIDPSPSVRVVKWVP